MIFVCGGAFQGQEEWAANKWKVAGDAVADPRQMETLQGVLQEEGAPRGGKVFGRKIRMLVHLEEYVRIALAAGRTQEEIRGEIRGLVQKEPDLILVTDEIGGGIIPMDPQERRLREVHGRLCCELAREADEVYHVSCGIADRLK